LLKVVMDELKDSPVFDGFLVRAAPISSTNDEWSYYYNFINELTTAKNACLIVEFPVDTMDGKRCPTEYDLTTVSPQLWSVNLYAGVENWVYDVFKTYNTKFEKAQIPTLLPVIYSSDYDLAEEGPNHIMQKNYLKQIFGEIDNGTLYNITTAGEIIFEFSDEWWKSSQSETGLDPEGCPNDNPYSHTSCGIRISEHNILYQEWCGIYSLRSAPFHSCMDPKIEAVETISQRWTKGNFTKYNTTICAPVSPLVSPFLPYPYSAMTFVVPFLLSLALVIITLYRPPKKTKRNEYKDAEILLSPIVG